MNVFSNLFSSVVGESDGMCVWVGCGVGIAVGMGDGSGVGTGVGKCVPFGHSLISVHVVVHVDALPHFVFSVYEYTQGTVGDGVGKLVSVGKGLGGVVGSGDGYAEKFVGDIVGWELFVAFHQVGIDVGRTVG